MHFTWTTFLFEILNFVVLAFVLHRLLYRPLREAIRKRQEANERARREAEKMRQEAEALRKDLDAGGAELERQRERVLHEAREQADAERRRLLADAEQTSSRRREEVRQALDQEREEALRLLRQEAVGMAVDLAERLMGEAVDDGLHRDLVLRLAGTLRRLPENDLERLRTGWQPDDGAVLETARELDAPTLGQVREAVAAALGRPAELDVRAAPALLGGARLRLGGWVYDVALAGQLEAVRQGRPEEDGPCPTQPHA
jgi:F-type H+-transporting ATPase subunit b